MVQFKWPADWRDADAMSYFLSDFSSHNVRPGRKLAFWSNLLCDVCQYRKTPVVGLGELKRCLAWRGMPPLCLEGVLDDMVTKGTVRKLEKLTETWTQWGVGILTSPLTSVWNKLLRQEGTEQRYVVMSVLKCCCSKILSEIHSTDKTLYKVSEWTQLLRAHVAPSNLHYINNYLTFSRDIITHGDPVALVKVRRATEKTVEPITQIDIALGKADMTRDTLTTQISSLDQKISELYKAAKQATRRTEALSHLRRKKMYEKSRTRWEGALNNTESLILQLQESQHHKIIISTLKVGADALQQNKISLNEVDTIMDQLDEYKSYEEDLHSALNTQNTDNVSDVDLESELRELLMTDDVTNRMCTDSSDVTDSFSETAEPASKRQSIKPIVIDLTADKEEVNLNLNISSNSYGIPDTDNTHNILSATELEELEHIEQELSVCPSVPDVCPSVSNEAEFENTEHAIERETIPKDIKARLSPELRRKPGRKLVGVMAAPE